MEAYPASALVLDLETAHTGADQAPVPIHMLGALRSGGGEELELKINRASPLDQALRSLDRMAEGADCLLGHNILAHDLPIIAQHDASLALLQLPVIDTLQLSPLAFPQNPYHRLIKGYKLVRDSLNSPLADCRASWTLFADQAEAFRKLADHRRQEFLCYQALIGADTCSGTGAFLAAVSGHPPLSLGEIAPIIPELLKESDTALGRDLKVCRTRLAQLLEIELYQPENHWPLAYALAWLRVSGGNSVLAPWVYHQFPGTGRLLRELRDIPCGSAECQYCQTTHDPRKELQRYYGFDDFRYESKEDDQSLQRDTVLAGMRDENVLAVLPTGGGKSLCYQLPALNRYHRNGSLTIIISPLQSLMKDQVDGLLDFNIECAAALNGLLSLPERADVLERLQMGDIGILLVSPEQFRNQGFRKAIAQRRIGAWIFDEAHCLSKWGNDFRPDYLYAARFIREFTGNDELAPIGCFTATAKPDVLEDIQAHFREHLDLVFRTFIGSPERDNLHFDVLPCTRDEKWGRTLELLGEELGSVEDEGEGGAVIFVASRRKSEELAAFVAQQGWPCAHYHAGLEPNEKKDIQNAFKAGALRVIVATNAFGMGVDKADIRLVVHAEIPGSLENYLQEAGRAGRDQQDARCVLLYDPNDIENQFGLTERSRLTLRDIQQILRKLRRESSRRKGHPLIITAGEILRDDSVDTSFEVGERDAETKVATAISWLERGEYLKREANVTRIFPARLGSSKEEAAQILDGAKLPRRKRQEYEAILGYLRAAGPDKRVSTDELMQLTDKAQDEVVHALRQLEELGLLVNDTQLTLYLRHGVADSAGQRLLKTAELEKALFEALAEAAPDAFNGEWQDLCVSTLTSTLKERLDQESLLPADVLRLLKSLSRDRSNDTGQRSSFELRPIDRDYLKLRVLNGYRWTQLEGLGERRRDVAAVLVPFLVEKLPSELRSKDAMVETSFGELEAQIDGDLTLRAIIPSAERRRAVEHVLLYLHQQGVVALNHGMTVMRRAMTIEVNEGKTGRYLKRDFSRLEEHYQERIIQVHVMREYAEVGRAAMADALRLVMDYFSLSKEDFLGRYFRGKQKILGRATSEESWQAIVGPLSPSQRTAVADDADHNRLILAGPGSGKTRVIVHRIAYLLRVKRVPARAIVALTFNRHAANEVRKRLQALVGQDAYGVTVLTYHSLAMRMTGVRFQRNESIDEQRLQAILAQAVDLLEGAAVASNDDELRDQLLGGYQYILVDEYQDIDELQYRLVSALAGRHVDPEQQLCILAVGDDDQNIYAWRHTSNRYIERFREDYQADIDYLVENYRSSRHIIEAANLLIAQNAGRLKQGHPISVDAVRRDSPAGGRWESADGVARGQVLRLLLPCTDSAEGNLQAQAALARLQALLDADAPDWSGCAILSRSHKYLAPVQAWCEQHAVPYYLAADKGRAPALTRHRDFVRFVDALFNLEVATGAEGLRGLLGDLVVADDWRQLLGDAIEQYQLEFGEATLKGPAQVDWFYDYFRDIRQKSAEGLYLGTVYSAKGLEFAHVVVLDSGWSKDARSMEDERRLYYVGMTRAAETLTLCEFAGGNPFSPSLKPATASTPWQGDVDPALRKQYLTLALSEIDIGYPGRQRGVGIHQNIARLAPGSVLTWQVEDGRHVFLDAQGNVVGRAAASFQFNGAVEEGTVAAIVVRYADDSEEAYRDRYRAPRWEVVVPKVTTRAE
ncbi:MAG: RecQ family ATP-dependent DNA helicase [Haliea sp.]